MMKEVTGRSPRMGVLYLKLVLTAVIWGGTFVAARIIAREGGPFAAAFLRFAVASVCLLSFLYVSYGKLPTIDRKSFVLVFLLGLTGAFAYNAFFFAGMRTVTAIRASLIIASQPAFIAGFSAVLFRERLGFLKIFGIVLSIFGAMVVISRGSPLTEIRENVGIGELFILGCVASWVSYSLIGKTAMERLSPVVAVTYACASGALCLLPAALVEGGWIGLTRYSAASWAGIAYLGALGSAVAFIWYYEGIKRIGPSRTGTFINIVPLSSVVPAFLILDETPDWSAAIGAVMVITGVYLMNRQHGERASVGVPEPLRRR